MSMETGMNQIFFIKRYPTSGRPYIPGSHDGQSTIFFIACRL